MYVCMYECVCMYMYVCMYECMYVYVLQLMASIKNAIEMLSTFQSESRVSTMQPQEQLHQCQPGSNSASAMKQLGKELLTKMKQSLEEVCL